MDLSPNEKNKLSVAFYPADAKKDISKEISKTLKDKFKNKTGSYKVPRAYWMLDAMSVLEAADNPESRVTEVIFDVNGSDEEALKALQSGIETFCDKVPVSRADWEMKIGGFKYNDDEKFKDALRENRYNDDRKRILGVKSQRDNVLIVTTVPTEDFFVGDINLNGDRTEERNAKSVYQTVFGYEWSKLSIGNMLKYLNSEKCRGTVFYDKCAERPKPTDDELQKAVRSVLENSKGRTGWMFIFKDPVNNPKNLVALNREGLPRYVISCGNRALLFVNKTMYKLWKDHLEKDHSLKVDKALTDQTDGFLPILFAASAPDSSVNELSVAGDVGILTGSSWKPFESIINDGGGRSGWSIVLEAKPYRDFFMDHKHVATGKVCDVKISRSDEKHTLEFLPLGKGAEMIFEHSKVKEEIDREKEKVEIPYFLGSENWSRADMRVPLGTVLEYVEKQADVCKDVLTIKIRYDDKTFIKDLKAFLPKAGNPNRPWELKVYVSEENPKDVVRKVEAINQTALRYKAVAKKSDVEEICISFEKKELSECVEDDGTLTLSEEEVAGTTLWALFKKLSGLNAAKDGKEPKVKMTNVTLPFGSDLPPDPWQDGMRRIGQEAQPAEPAHLLKEAVVMLVKNGLNEDWNTLTLDLKGDFDAKAFEKAVNETLKAES